MVELPSEFPSWGPVVFKITLGELITALSAAGAAIWVGLQIQRRNDVNRAVKRLLMELCSDTIEALNNVGDIVENVCPERKSQLTPGLRQRLNKALQAFSNAVFLIDGAVAKSASKSTSVNLSSLMKDRENLRTKILEPLASSQAFNDVSLREIQGAILRARETLVSLELEIIAS